MNPKPRAYSYIRFSSSDQLKGDSLRRQLTLSQRYAEENGLELDNTLSLKDLGVSAFRGVNVEKGALGVFLAAVSAGKIARGSYLLVESLDRLSRANVPAALPIFLEIINAGIIIVTMSDGMKYSEQAIVENWTQLVVSLAIMARAHEESATKSKRLSAVWQQKKSEASINIVTTVVPAWLKVKGKTIEVDEEKAEIVRDIFQAIKNGVGFHLLEKRMNENAVMPIGKTKRWHRSYLIKIVSNRAVIGEYQPMTGKGPARKASGDPVPDYYPKIITDAEFFSAQQAVKDRTHKGGRKGANIANIFSGLCKCGYCAGAVRYINKGADTKWQYLLCSKAKSGLECRHVYWKYAEIEHLILSRLPRLNIAAILKDGGAESKRQEIDAIKTLHSQLKQKLSNLIALAEVAQNIDEIALRLAEIKKQELATLEQLRALESSAAVPEMGERHFEKFRQLQNALTSAQGNDLAELRLRINHELKRFVDRIEIYPEGAAPWTFEMKAIGIEPTREGRFVAVIFKNGDGHIFHASGKGTLWRGPSSPERIEKAKRILPFI